MNQDVFLMHFEERKRQQKSRILVFVRKRVISKYEIVSSDAVYHMYMQMSSSKFVSIDDLVFQLDLENRLCTLFFVCSF